MTVRDWNKWPAQEPPSDFTTRTVDMLIQAESRAASNVRPTKRTRRVWAGVFALAAALAAGTSWAMIHHGAFRSEQPEVAPVPPAASSPPAPVAAPNSVRRFVERPVETAPAPLPPVVHSVAAPAPPPAPPASASASAPAKVILVPRCDCEPGAYMCSCFN